MAKGFWGQQLQEFFGGLFGNDYVRDFQHAAKTFRPNAYQNAPKYKFLFHVVFEINDAAWPSAGAEFNYGILVKDIQLPSFKMDVKEFNQYNRKRLAQTKINYDPIQITFHDDNASQVSQMWYAYYTYYYADSRNVDVFFNDTQGGGTIASLPAPYLAGLNVTPTTGYNGRNIYEPSLAGQMNWGYVGEEGNKANVFLKKEPFFKNITVFGFSSHNFIAYTLVNPIITTFSHDKYSYDEANTTMKNNMTIDYETVVYNVGYIDGQNPSEIVRGFGSQENYDRKPSPITLPGANGAILGPNGILAGVGGSLQMMGKGNFLGGLLGLGSIYYHNKDRNWKASFKEEMRQGFYNATNDYPVRSRPTPVFYPGLGQTQDTVNTAGAPPAGANFGPDTTFGSSNGEGGQFTDRTAGKQVNTTTRGNKNPATLALQQRQTPVRPGS